jgi:hypothetical protein
MGGAREAALVNAAEQVAIDTADLRSIYGLDIGAADAAWQRLRTALAEGDASAPEPAQWSANYCLALELLRRSGASGTIQLPAASPSRLRGP